MSTRALVDAFFTKHLAERSKLFEIGRIQDALSEDQFIFRLNGLVAASSKNPKLRPPGNLASAIFADGKLNEHAELVVFGHWLLLDNAPGLLPKGGRQINRRLVMKTIAAAVAELRSLPALAKDEEKPSPIRITKNGLAQRWQKLYGDPAKPKQFDARLRTLRRILPAYFVQLKAGKIEHAGKPIKKSPQLEKLMAGITPQSKRPASTPTKTAPSTSVGSTPTMLAPASPTRAALTPFEIDLHYSSTDRETEYRERPAGSVALAKLRYLPEDVAPSAKTGAIRKDLEGRIVLKPEMAIRDQFKVTALIDRLAIMLSTRDETSRQIVKKAINRETKSIVFVHDRTLRNTDSQTDWRDALPTLDKGKLTGQHFAIMIQEPDPTSLIAILNLLDREFGIDGDIVPFLLELSLDFHPSKSHTPEQKFLLREQMVGLLQRHHWASHELLAGGAEERSTKADARQIYGQDSKPRYLFARRKEDRSSSDARVDRKVVRRRLLQTKPGNDLYLDATVYKGAKLSPFLISIQHKIADRRNQAAHSKTTLNGDERRARIEVTIAGREQLGERGLLTIDDLNLGLFRKMRKSLLQFKLGALRPEQHLLDQAIQQTATRGVYGMELRERAQIQEDRSLIKRQTGKTPRNKDREELGLVDWQELNTTVGHALDQLGRRWGSFSWGAKK